MELKEQIDKVIGRVEYSELEYKSAKGGFPHSFWETYSAFANSEGGIIVLGVAERDGKVVVDGLTSEQTERYLRYFWENVNN